MFVFCSDTAVLGKCLTSFWFSTVSIFLYPPTFEEGFSIFKEYNYTEANEFCENTTILHDTDPSWRFGDSVRKCVQTTIRDVKGFYDITDTLNYTLWSQNPARRQQLVVCDIPSK